MRSRAYLSVVVFVYMATASVYAQFTPVIARERVTTETINNGKVVKTDVKEGEYYRTADGSTLERWTTLEGSRLSGTGTLFDNHALVTYHLNYRNMNAYESKFKPTQPVPADSFANSSSLPSEGTGEVAGIACTKIPFLMEMPDGKRQRIGEACVSSQYNLILRTETRNNGVAGSSTRTVKEMFQVRLNTPPDPQLFQVRGKFTVFTPDATQPVSNE
ncbi:MAG TPA: hypothetical protein VFI95_09965 [Terriglobales bacterium]|nr:hypothetical protein [Terriglobales bacterium]